ncbi:ABC transporter ATP-binding protein [Phyllobacterium salinisoli]|uniref:ABC transporter ATP-binding protein n=1 Tax=Phyllobacterium salinisoli TaxID=1899321 RepID=A0A368JX49_9HYPH|nr:ATP-binding cassette domain-containing protein [Phyllobacterium salinisoli]RCS21738.1 ABC transporter ATP-binding protein [Phyllobacterium salinisoli]
MTPLLTVENATVESATGRIVAPVSLTLQAGRPFTILGETGSGKSLFAQAIMGLLPVGLTASGRVIIDGQVLDLADPASHRPLWGRQVGILPQEPWLALDPTMRVARQVADGHRFIRRLEAAAAMKAAADDLTALGVAGAGRKLPGELSGGMAQRVAFAAARAGGARIIIADEPTKGLDVARRDEVIALLMKEVEAGGAVLTITHDLALARQMGGDFAVMFDGSIVEQGEADMVLSAPSHDYTKQLIAADPENWNERKVPAGKRDDIVLVAEDLAKARGGRLLFSGQGLRLHKGEIVGVTGASGSGKSSLGDILLGLLKPDAGTVARALGVAPVRYQKIYQDPPSAFPGRITIGANVSDLVHLHRLDVGRIAPLMKRLKLAPELLHRLPTEVSGGELQRFALLRVLLLDPVFLFADEPTSRLDLITQQETIELLVELAREQDCAVLIVSHDTALIEKTCDRRIEIGEKGGAEASVA